MGRNVENLADKPPKSNGLHGLQGKGYVGVGKIQNEVIKQSKSDHSIKRTQSATGFKNQGPTAQKANLMHRKASDSELDLPARRPLLRSMSASKNLQRRLSKASRVSIDSDQSSDKNVPATTSLSASNLPTKSNGSKKRLPFSFSSDYNDDPHSSKDQIIGDVQGLEIKRNLSSPPKRQLSFSLAPSIENPSRSGNHVQFADLKSSSIKMEIMEQPDACLEDMNEDMADGNYFDYKVEDKTSHEMNREMQTNTFRNWKRDFENEVKNLIVSPARETANLSDTKESDGQKVTSKLNFKPSRDELMIAKTDDLILEVAKFITQIKSSRTENFPVDMNLSTGHGSNQEPDSDLASQSRVFNFSGFEDSDGISSITCPSVVLNQSGQSTFRETLGHEEIAISRPASASLRKSFSNDDIHGRISFTLRMIEQEEKRDLTKKGPVFENFPDYADRLQSSRCGSFLPSVSNPSSRPPSRSSQMNFIPPQASSPKICYANSSPASSLPRIDSFVNYPTDLQSARSFYSDHFSVKERPGTAASEIKELVKVSKHQQYFQYDQRDTVQGECRPEQRNYNEEGQSHQPNPRESERHKASGDCVWETSHEKTKKIFSFLDEVEKSDRETLFVLKYDPPQGQSNLEEKNFSHQEFKGKSRANTGMGNTSKPDLTHLKTMDSLIRKGSVELAREQIILERNLEESQHRIRVLEETLMQQRELNMRNLRNSEKDLRKRLNLQKEEFDLAFSRNEALINEMATEKRMLQERCDKLMKNFDDNVEKYKEQIKSLQQKHLDEIKRLRKAQLNAENVRKQQWVGNKTQEIKEMTVKGLEPEVQRIIQRHQQEMSEVRAWHSDEVRETEERYQRKLNMQLQDMREKFARDLEETISREKELANKRLESELKQREDDFEMQRRRLTNDLYEEKERVACEEIKWKDLMQENIRKVQIKADIQLENLKQEYETKMANLERRHESELKSLKDIYEVEKESWISNCEKKCDQAVRDREIKVTETLRLEMDKEFKEREKRLRDEFEKKEDEEITETRNKRIQEKLQAELAEMDQTEKDLKVKFSLAKSEIISLEEQVFSLKTSLNLKEKQNNELQESNLKMLEERANLTSVIRREFTTQIESLEEEVRSMKSTFLEIEAKHKLELEQFQMEIDKVGQEKDNEIDKIGIRVKQAVSRKEETIQELQKQLEKANFNIQHLEGLIEQQRKDFLDSMTSSMVGGGKRK